jgi:hypothetical protein
LVAIFLVSIFLVAIFLVALFLVTIFLVAIFLVAIFKLSGRHLPGRHIPGHHLPGAAILLPFVIALVSSSARQRLELDFGFGRLKKVGPGNEAIVLLPDTSKYLVVIHATKEGLACEIKVGARGLKAIIIMSCQANSA